MDLPSLLHHYGYGLILVGTFAEGETLLMLGGYFAHRGYLEFAGVVAVAFVGAVCGDQFFFWLGRHHAQRLLGRFPRLRERVDVALRKMDRHQVKVVLGMRFLWGLRIALPIALGLGTMRARRFVWLNLISAAIWAHLFAGIGYVAGELVQRLEADVKRYEKGMALLLVLAAVAALVWHAGRPKSAGPSNIPPSNQ